MMLGTESESVNAPCESMAFVHYRTTPMFNDMAENFRQPLSVFGAVVIFYKALIGIETQTERHVLCILLY